MKNIYRILFLLMVVGLFGFSTPFSWLFTSHTNSESFGTNSWLERQMTILKAQAHNIDTKVLRLSLLAYTKAKQKGLLNQKSLLTVIDYSKPSYENRLWVFDVKRGRALFNTLVSHGKNSGGANATSFSNNPGSLKSSIGVFLTRESYFGKNGYSLRLRGLESGINDNAYRRSVVVHGAWYVNTDTIRRYGQVGRSWGCPAVSDDLAESLINTIKGNTLIVAYYPDRNWLSNSQFLT